MVTTRIRNQAALAAKGATPDRPVVRKTREYPLGGNDFGRLCIGSHREHRLDVPRRTVQHEVGHPRSRQACDAFSVMVAANGWVASTTAVISLSTNHFRSPATPRIRRSGPGPPVARDRTPGRPAS